MDHNSNLSGILQRAREELLDLSARNRLINTPRDPNRGKKLDIVDERSEEVFRLLVRERRAMRGGPTTQRGRSGKAIVIGSSQCPRARPALYQTLRSRRRRE